MTEAAAVIALVFGIYMGFSAASRLKERESLLKQMSQFLLHLKISLEYGGKPLGELLFELLNDSRFASLSFLQSVTLELEHGASFPQAWKTAVKRDAQRLGCEASEELLRLGALLGATDKPGQTELLTGALLRFDSLCKAAKEKRERCAMLYRAAGAFAGFAVFILVI